MPTATVFDVVPYDGLEVHPSSRRPGSGGPPEVTVHFFAGGEVVARQFAARSLTVEVVAVLCDCGVRFAGYLLIRHGPGITETHRESLRADYPTPGDAVNAVWKGKTPCPLRVRFTMPGPVDALPASTFMEAFVRQGRCGNSFWLEQCVRVMLALGDLGVPADMPYSKWPDAGTA